MNQSFPIRALLGITQDKMAQLLEINRSQWSMFESGLRDLPIHAKLVLAEMMKVLLQPKGTEKRSSAYGRNANMERYLSKRLHRNKINQLSNERKLIAATKKNQKIQAVLQVAQMFTDQPAKKTDASLELISQMSAKASLMEVKGVTAVLRYEFHLELLQLERQHLEASLKKHIGKPDNVES